MNFQKHVYPPTRRAAQSGNALITLLIVSAASILVIGAAVASIITSSQGATRVSTSQQTLQVAEGGMENALMRILRDPSYSGETLTIGDGTATITVSGTNPTIVTSRGVVGSVTRTVETQLTFNGGSMTVSSWREL